jgi:hypothetical protein
MNEPCSRRRFLSRSLLLLGATTAATPASTAAWLPQLGERITSWRLAGLFRDPGSAIVVGRRYLRMRPAEAELSTLLEWVLPQGLRLRPEHEIRSILANRIRADFESRRTVELEGWVLSETEVRLCALLALMSRST